MINPKPRPCADLTIRATRADRTCAERNKRWVLVAAVLGSSMSFLDESIVNVALPKIEANLATTLPAMQWVVNAYTLCMSALILAGGAAADRLGRRRIFLLGIGIFATASVVCGLAPRVEALILARVIQGLGAALLIPCSLALIGATYNEHERGAAIGIWSGASAIAAGGGPLLGGWLIDHLSWRAIFLINPLLAAPTIWIAIRHVPETRDPEATGGLDWIGAALVFAGLAGLAYGLIAASTRGWSDPAIITALIAGGTLLAAFIWHEQRSRNPMMPLVLFRSRNFTGVNLMTLLLYGALGGAFFFVPFLLIQAHGYSATEAGAAFLPFTIILGVLSRTSGQLADRFGARRPLIIGPIIVACGFLLLLWVSNQQAFWIFLIPMSVVGFGMAVTVAPLTTLVVNAVPESATGIASGINNAVASVASLLAISALGTVALSTYTQALDRQLQLQQAPAQLREQVATRRGALAPANSNREKPTDDPVESIVQPAFIEMFHSIMALAAVLCFASAGVAGLTIKDERPGVPNPRQTPSAAR
jgi:EmrB/QacA subfamily drug resistance transporter